MVNYSLEVIPEPEKGTASILKTDQGEDFVFIKGNGDIDYLCGTCDKVICKNVNRGQISNLVFVCPKCGSYNKLKGT